MLLEMCRQELARGSVSGKAQKNTAILSKGMGQERLVRRPAPCVARACRCLLAISQTRHGVCAGKDEKGKGKAAAAAKAVKKGTFKKERKVRQPVLRAGRCLPIEILIECHGAPPVTQARMAGGRLQTHLWAVVRACAYRCGLLLVHYPLPCGSLELG